MPPFARRKTARVRPRLFYGASHVASDTYTGRLRRLFQARFGDAGHGFVLPAKPWRYYRHRDVVIDGGTLTWWGDWVRKPRALRRLARPAGVSISSSSPNDYASVATTKDNPQGQRVSRFRCVLSETTRRRKFRPLAGWKTNPTSLHSRTGSGGSVRNHHGSRRGASTQTGSGR